jgi:hypothetical protein
MAEYSKLRAALWCFGQSAPGHFFSISPNSDMLWEVAGGRRVGAKAVEQHGPAILGLVRSHDEGEPIGSCTSADPSSLS